jgi:hypothetical protein
LPERYQDLAWNLVRRIYFRALGNRKLLDPIFENLIKVSESNAVFWEKMKLVEEKAKDIEQSYDDLISAASSIAHFDYQFPLDLSMKKLEKHHERHQVRRLAKREKNRCSNNPKKKCTAHSSRGHTRNECSNEYEHHFAFTVTETSTKVPVTETVNRSFHSAGTPIATPNGNGGYFATDLEADLYEENNNLQGVLSKLTHFLAARHPDLLHDMEKMNIFGESAKFPDVEMGASHSGHSTVPGNDSSNLRHAFDAESQSQPPPHTSTAGAALGTNSSRHLHPVSSSVSFKNIFSGENILKPLADENLKGNNSVSESNLGVNNQPVLTAPIISNNNSNNNLSLTKHGLDKLSSTMSAAKLQKSLFESAKRLKLKEFKYDANPSVVWWLFKSFY